MNFWKRYPLFRILPVFIAGLVTGIFYPNIDKNVLMALSLAFILFFIVYQFIIKKIYRYHYLFGICLLTAYFIFGLALPNCFQSKDKNIESGIYLAKVNERLLEKEKSFKTEVTLLERWDKKTSERQKKLVVYIRKDSIPIQLKTGEIIAINIKPNEIPAPANPGEFNYKRFMYFREIHYQTFISKNEIIQLNQFQKDIFYYTDLITSYFIGELRRYQFPEKEFSIFAALLLGVKDFLDAETVFEFSSSGAMHVLAVSGLHVGIIFTVIQFILLKIFRLKKGKTLFIISTLLVWMYAFLTGLSPSVCRAATMFSFISFGKNTKKRVDIYNMMAVSFIFLCCVNPFVITEVGFQLSYLAVLGIIYLQKPIYGLLYFNKKIFDYIWQITSVSLAAQIFTFPLGILYFHQFPVYFLLSNLIVIPLAGIIINAGLFFLTFSKLLYIGKIAYWCNYYLVYLLSFGVSYVDNLPYSLALGLYFNIAETYFVYAIILGISLWLINGFKKSIWLAMIGIAGFLLSKNDAKIDLLANTKVNIYSMQNKFAVDFIKGTHHFLWADATTIKNASLQRFHLYNFWFKHSLNYQIEANNERDKHLIQAIDSNLIGFHGKLFQLVDHQNNMNWVGDYIIVNKKMKLNTIQISNKKATILAANGLAISFKNKLKNFCIEKQIKFYDLNANGALSINL